MSWKGPTSITESKPTRICETRLSLALFQGPGPSRSATKAGKWPRGWCDHSHTVTTSRDKFTQTLFCSSGTSFSKADKHPCAFISPDTITGDACSDLHPQTPAWFLISGVYIGKRLLWPHGGIKRLYRQVQTHLVHAALLGSRKLSFVFCLSREQSIDASQLYSTEDMVAGRNWIYSAFHSTFCHSNNFTDMKFCLE